VPLPVSGAAFFAEAMQILASAERAVAAARQAGDLARCFTSAGQSGIGQEREIVRLDPLGSLSPMATLSELGAIASTGWRRASRVLRSGQDSWA
jgi:hypothetical protein